MTTAETLRSADLYHDVMVTPKHAIETYLYTLVEDGDDYRAETEASEIMCDDRQLAATQVLVPIAAHQESAETVLRALEQYASQKPIEAFTVILFLNFPQGLEELSNVRKLEATISRFQTDNPGMDIRYFTTGIKEGTSIGDIRKTLWDAALVASWYDSLFEKGDVIGISHDIDLLSLHPSYIRRVQEHYAAKTASSNGQQGIGYPISELASAFTMLWHDYPFDTHPNIARGIFWKDYVLRQGAIKKNAGYSAGVAIPFSLYALKGGFPSDKDTHETSSFYSERTTVIPRTHGTTSPRRFISRMPHIASLLDIWEPGTFGQTDECRTATDGADISHELLEVQIFETLRESIEGYILASNLIPDLQAYYKQRCLELKSSTQGHCITKEALRAEVEEFVRSKAAIKIRQVTSVLRDIVGSDLLAAIVAEEYTPDSVAHYFRKTISMYAGILFSCQPAPAPSGATDIQT